MKVGIRRIGILLVVAMCAVSIASVATAQETPFVIEGRVFYEGGIPCNAPLVCIENLNTAESGTAETTGTSNYYLLILDSVDLDAGDVLRFNTTKGQHFNISDYTITAEEIEEGGLFDFDITLVSVGAPDLVITNVSEEWINVGNKTYRVRYTVRNIGDAPSQASTTYLYIEDTHIGNDTTGTLVEGENYTSVFESVITGTSLNDTIIVCADGDDLITEGNETNNCLERIVEFVAMPDLRVRTITTPESILYDLSNRINATVDNIGEIDAGTFNVTLEADGNLVDTEVVTALDASFNITVSFAWTPSATGEQTLKVIADTDDQIEESNEYNNELTEGVDVVAMPEPLIVWAYTQDSRHFQDAERLDNGNTLISTSLSIIEIDTDGNILWVCPDPGFPYDAERLENGNTLIASTSVNRVIEVAPAGTIVWEVGADFPSDAERLDNGNTLIACWGKVIEVAPNKTVVWQYTDVDEAMSAERLDNGNTLIADYPNHHIIEVASNGTIVWAVGATWPTDAERLENGNTLIVEKEWVKELNHDGEIVWKYYTGLYTSPQDVELLENGNTLITYYESPAKVVEIVQPLPGCSRDIFMSNLNMPQDIYAGFANLIKVTVVNVGDTNISDSFDVTLRADGLLIETETIKSIPARSVVMVTFSWTPEGIDEYTLTVTADSDDQIDETDETNNELSRDVLTTISEPDLIIESVIFETEGFQNEENTISVTVDNIGYRNIETPFNLTVNLDGELLGEATIDALIGDDKKRVEFSWLPEVSGDCIFTAAIDSNDAITESNETMSGIAASLLLPFLILMTSYGLAVPALPGHGVR